MQGLFPPDRGLVRLVLSEYYVLAVEMQLNTGQKREQMGVQERACSRSRQYVCNLTMNTYTPNTPRRLLGFQGLTRKYLTSPCMTCMAPSGEIIDDAKATNRSLSQVRQTATVTSMQDVRLQPPLRLIMGAGRESGAAERGS